MVINRKIMQNMGICEKNIQLIQNKTRIYKGVKVFDRMNTTLKGHISSCPHFDLLELIEAQREYVKVVRTTNVKRNKQILAMLEELRDDLNEKDLELKRVQL